MITGLVTCRRFLAARGIMAGKEQTMGDKGGKKDKEKIKQQHVKKQKEEAQRKQDNARPRTQ